MLAACDASTRIVFLCSPNNPTGNAMNPADVERLLGALAWRALVVVDEAYIEFSGDASLTQALARFPNLVVLRTLSKALGLAGARVGSLIAAPEIVALLAKVIPPYSIPQLTIEAVLATLAPAQLAIQRERVAQVRAERERAARGAGRQTVGCSASGPASPTSCSWTFAMPEAGAGRGARREIVDPRHAQRVAAQSCAFPWALPNRTTDSSGASRERSQGTFRRPRRHADRGTAR